MPSCLNDPEKIPEPKEFLRDLVWKLSDKTTRYVNTVHNVKIAENLTISALRKCKAFLPLEKFWLDVA
jgi:hypothetical protein